MRKLHRVKCGVAVVGIAGFCGAVLAPLAALADNSPYTAPDKVAIDPNGVDLLGLHLMKPQTFLTIGDPNAGGLVVDYQGPQSHSYAGAIVYWGKKAGTSSPGYVTLNQLRVKIGGSTDTFYMQPSNASCATACPNENGPGNSIAKSGSNWIYTSKDGAIYTFDALDTPAYSSTRVEQFIGKLQSILRPDGTFITINYDINPTCPIAGTCYRIKSVISNRGYALRFNYAGGGYGAPSSIDGINLLAHTCDALAQVCDAVDVTQNGGMKDGLGNQTTITEVNAGNTDPLDNTIVYSLTHYASPEGVTIDCTYDGYGRIKTLTKPTGTWTYSYSDVNFTQIALPGTHTITLKNPANAVVLTAVVGKGGDETGPTLNSTMDANNRTTRYGYIAYDGGTFSYTRLSSVTPPEGDYIGHTGQTQYSYDTRGNVTAVIKVPKSGSGLSSTSITASYPSTCTYAKTCNQPTWTKDAKGNQADYTYDNTHGGVLTVTLPADQNGLRQRTYNTYTAYNTGNGTIYRLTRSETCGLTSAQLTLTACPADINTSVTLTDYGTSSTAPYTYKSNQPYQVTVRDNRASGYDSATTTYAYDKVGNVMSVDGPLSGTNDKSFTTYDANRRKIFEIGPIPGGTGVHRRVVHHWYDADGREWKTENGYSNTDATDGSGFVVVNFTRVTFDAAGRPGRTEVVQP
ncbi:hypothetical protein ASTA108788_16910 [Asticcacaulis taihuensis]